MPGMEKVLIELKAFWWYVIHCYSLIRVGHPPWRPYNGVSPTTEALWHTIYCDGQCQCTDKQDRHCLGCGREDRRQNQKWPRQDGPRAPPAQRRPGAMRQGTLLPRVRAHCPIGNHLSFSNQMSKKLSPFSKKAWFWLIFFPLYGVKLKDQMDGSILVSQRETFYIGKGSKLVFL